MVNRGERHLTSSMSKLVRSDFSKRMIRGSGVSIGLKVSGTFLVFLVSIVLARALGAEGFGIYSYVFAIVSLLAIPVEFGLPNLVVRETAKARAQERWGLIRGIWTWATIAACALAVGVALTAIILIYLFGSRLTQQHLQTLYLGLLLIPLLALGNIRGAALRGLHHIAAGLLPEIFIRPLLLIVFVIAAIYFWPSHLLTAANAMGMHTAAAAISFVVGAIFLVKARPVPSWRPIRPEYNSPEWIKATLPLAAIASFQLLNKYTDILILGMFVDSAEIGIYRVASQGSLPVALGVQAIGLAFGPHFAHLHAVNDKAKLRNAFRLGGWVGLATAVPTFIIYFLWGEPLLLHVFGKEFSAAYPSLVILSLGQLVYASAAPAGTLLNMTGHEKQMAVTVLIAAGSNIVLNFILIPRFGTVGAASATALSFAIWSASMTYFVRRCLQSAS